MVTETQRRVVGAVTLLRVPLAIALPIVPVGWRGPLFSLAASTDVIDGRLARAWGVASPGGARLDSFADAVLVGGTAAAVVGTIDVASRRTVVVGAGAVAVVRISSLLITRCRFGRWSIAHTHANKAAGSILAVVATGALVVRRVSMPGLAVAGGVAMAAALEELAIVVCAERYDPDVAGLRRRAA